MNQPGITHHLSGLERKVSSRSSAKLMARWLGVLSIRVRTDMSVKQFVKGLVQWEFRFREQPAQQICHDHEIRHTRTREVEIRAKLLGLYNGKIRPDRPNFSPKVNDHHRPRRSNQDTSAPPSWCRSLVAEVDFPPLQKTMQLPAHTQTACYRSGNSPITRQSPSFRAPSAIHGHRSGRVCGLRFPR